MRRVALLLLVPTAALALVPTARRLARPRAALVSSSASSDDDDEAAPSVDDADWRAFRARLIEGGIRTTGDDAADAAAPAPARAETTTTKKAGLDPANTELARGQSPSLAGDLDGTWAHGLERAEVGSLLLRLPLETQLCVARDTHWGRKLRESYANEKTRAAMDEGRRRGVPASEVARVDADDADEAALYRAATRLLTRELSRIAGRGQTDDSGRLFIDPAALTPEDRDLLEMHQNYLGGWQEVVLVVHHDAASSTGVVINRPAATEASPELAEALVAIMEDAVDVAAFSAAFGPKCAAYVGKPAIRTAGAPPAAAARRAMVIHGVPGLAGAAELAPGLGIYRGGAAAAAAAVAGDAADALDFRFFIDRYDWAPGELDGLIRSGRYRACACSRGVALKQCLGLPKPLWNEVMEMLGGTSLEISKLETARRENPGA